MGKSVETFKNHKSLNLEDQQEDGGGMPCDDPTPMSQIHHQYVIYKVTKWQLSLYFLIHSHKITVITLLLIHSHEMAGVTLLLIHDHRWNW